MRKLAREATIFALLGFLTGTISLFWITENKSRFSARVAAARAVHALPQEEFVIPTDVQNLPPGLVPIDATVEVPLTNGMILQVRQCEPLPTPPPGYTLDSPESRSDCRYFSGPSGGRFRLTRLVLGSADQIAIEKEYWAAYSKAKRQSLAENGMASLILGLWGFPAGIGIWAFYRLVRFAIKG
jgi:hypothetical protein